jgi:hypothetical protein
MCKVTSEAKDERMPWNNARQWPTSEADKAKSRVYNANSERRQRKAKNTAKTVTCRETMKHTTYILEARRTSFSHQEWHRAPRNKRKRCSHKSELTCMFAPCINTPLIAPLTANKRRDLRQPSLLLLVRTTVHTAHFLFSVYPLYSTYTACFPTVCAAHSLFSHCLRGALLVSHCLRGALLVSP